MEKRRITCREHGGYFYVTPRRGRPPVKCTEENKCTGTRNVPSESAVSVRGSRKGTRSGTTPAPTEVATRKTRSSGATAANSTVSATPATTRKRASSAVDGSNDNQTLAMAKHSKELLEEMGWTVRGKFWHEGDDVYASVTAARGPEMFYGVFKNSQQITSDYSLWNLEQPQKNANPYGKNLPFDPDEIGDSDLVRMLIGQRVTWYNRLSQKLETAFCGKDTLTVEHIYDGYGDETPGARIIKFVDSVNGTGYRAFRLDALTHVGTPGYDGYKKSRRGE